MLSIISSISVDLGIFIGLHQFCRTSRVPNASVAVPPSEISTAVRGSKIILHCVSPH